MPVVKRAPGGPKRKQADTKKGNAPKKAKKAQSKSEASDSSSSEGADVFQVDCEQFVTMNCMRFVTACVLSVYLMPQHAAMR